MTNIPKIIRKARRDKELSQDQIAKYLGYSHRSNVQRLEAGILELKAKHLIELAALLNIDLNELKEGIMFEKAKARVEDSPQLAPHADFILADWPEGDEHWFWVVTAAEQKILDWVEAGSK